MKIDKNTFGVASMILGLIITFVGACLIDPPPESADHKKYNTRSAYDPKEYEKTRNWYR